MYLILVLHVSEKMKIKSEKYIGSIWAKKQLWIWEKKTDDRNTDGGAPRWHSG